MKKSTSKRIHSYSLWSSPFAFAVYWFWLHIHDFQTDRATLKWLVFQVVISLKLVWDNCLLSLKVILLNSALAAHFSFYSYEIRCLGKAGGKHKLCCAIVCKFCMSSANRCYWSLSPRFVWGCKPNLGSMVSILCISHSQIRKIYHKVWKVVDLSSPTFHSSGPLSSCC